MDHDPELDRSKQVDVANKFKKAITNKMLASVSDEIRHLSELETICLQRQTNGAKTVTY